MRKSLLLMLLMLASVASHAYDVYHFEKTEGTYTPLTGDTAVSPITSINDTNSYLYIVQFAGDTFRFFNKNYVINDNNVFIAFSTDGHIEVVDNASYIIFDGLFTYLDSIDNTSRVSYKVEGTGANKILKVQWSNLRLRYGAANNTASVQMWLYKATGVLEVHYGPSTNNDSGYDDFSGPNVGVFYSDNTFTNLYEKVWINGLPSNYTIDSAHNFNFMAMHGVPSEGTVYRFVPNTSPNSIGNTSAPQEGYQLYPNPANNNLVVTAHATAAADIYLIDVQGRILQATKLNAAIGRAIINTEHISAGQYFVKIAEPSHEYVYQVTVTH